MEQRQRACTEQYNLLVEFMERNGDLARPQASAQERLCSEQLWQELTNLLNSVEGGPQKPTDKWKKAWADWKTKTKKKGSLIHPAASGTGGGPSSRIKLTSLEERVLNILGVSAVTGDEEVQEQGFEVQLHYMQSSSPAQPSATQPSRETAFATAPVPPSVSASMQEDITSTNARESQPSTVPSEQSTPCRIRGRPVRRQRTLTPFERASNQFVAVEKARLRMEEERDRGLHEREVERERMLHEREMERLRVDAQRVEVERARNVILQNFADIPQLLTQLLQQSKQ